MPHFAEKWLIAGASGLLGVRLASHLKARHRQVVALHWEHALPTNLAPDGLRLDLLDGEDACRRVIADIAPDVVVNCAGLTNVDQCEAAPDQAALLNTDLAGRMAEASSEQGSCFVQISTDHLWDGTRALVAEDVPLQPINVYGRTKAAGEREVHQADPSFLILRTNFFGPSLPWRTSFNDWLTEELTKGHAVNAFADVFFTPVATDLLSVMLVGLVDRRASGILNLAGAEQVSKHDFALRWAMHKGLDGSLVQAGSITDCNLKAQRPRDMSLDCAKAAAILGHPMPSLDESFLACDGALTAHETETQRGLS